MELELPAAHRYTAITGRIVFDVPDWAMATWRDLCKRGADHGDFFAVRIGLVRRKRSTGPLSQGHHLNGHVSQIANATGQDFEAVKLYVKRAAIARGLPLKLKPDGDVLLSIVDGEPVPISEADMDTVQCGWCIEEVHILAAELGIVLREE